MFLYTALGEQTQSLQELVDDTAKLAPHDGGVHERVEHVLRGVVAVDDHVGAFSYAMVRLPARRILVGAPAPADPGVALGVVDKDLLAQFERAFTAELRLAFDYVDRNGNASRRRVEPQALLLRAPFWYVIAWDPLRDALRLFRMDRIRRPKVVEGETFQQRALSTVAGVCPDARRPVVSFLRASP